MSSAGMEKGKVNRIEGATICAYIARKLEYSNFRKYATPPDEKRCIIMEKSFLCTLGIFLVLVLLKSF